jgi:hypothetical protein
MTRKAPQPWAVYGPPLVAALVTFLLFGFVGMLGRGEYSPDGFGALLPLLLLPIPFIISVAWAGAQLMGPPNWSVSIFGVACAGLGLSLFSVDIVFQMGGQIAAGVLAGMALQMRWRLDVALVIVALAMAPALIRATQELPVTEQFEVLGDQMMELYKESMPVGADVKQQALAMEEQRRQWDKVAFAAEQFYPATLVIGLFGQAGVILALVWLLSRPLGLVVGLTGFRPFLEWRVPFYVVWVLVVGIGLYVTRQAVLMPLGLTLMTLAAMLLSIQGFAIQVFLTSRTISGPGRVIFWIVMSVLFWFVLLISGLLLGLADQWIDLRRHLAAAGPPSDGQS